MSGDHKDEERKVPSWQLPQERQPETDAYHIWTPRPLLRSIYWKPVPAPPFEAVSATYEIFLDQRAWLTMHEHVWQTPADKTPFGYLIGDLCEDPTANRRFVTITAALPARFDFREDASEQISREATLALQLEVERRRGVLAGWYHRHVGGGVKMSEADVQTHHRHFSEPWQCAFVFVGGDDRSEGGCFRSSPEAFAGDLLLPFYEMASNESLLARGVKRSYVDWTNYSTVDEIRSDAPPRPALHVSAPAVSTPPTPPEAPPGPPPADEPPVARVQPEVRGPSSAVGEDSAAGKPARTEATAPEEGAAGAGAEGVGPGPEREPEPESAIEPEPADESEPAAETARGGQPAAGRPHDEADDTGSGPSVDEAESTGRSRPPRIELDPYATPAPMREDVERTSTAADVTSDMALEQASLTPEPAPARSSAPASRPSAETGLLADRKKVIGLAAGALVLVAVAVGGFAVLSGDGGDATATAGETVDSEAGAAPAVSPAARAAAVDSAGQAMLATISTFYGRAVARDNGEATCDDLARAFIDVENAWIAYNTSKAEFEAPLPEQLAARDTRLYAGVQDTEREYERSGCPRP